jgi:hypothetical protein
VGIEKLYTNIISADAQANPQKREAHTARHGVARAN